MNSPLPSAVKLLSTHRQQQLLIGLQGRHQQTLRRRQELEQRQQAEATSLEAELAAAHERTLSACRLHRHDALLEWDEADEHLVSEYETQTLQKREELHRLAAKFRQQRRAERKAVLGKVEARCDAIQDQYKRRKNQPVEQQHREVSKLERALAHAQQTLETVRAIVVRRLDYLPEAPPLAHADQPSKPATVEEAEEAILLSGRQIEETGRTLLASTPARLVDTFWILPSICCAFLLIWAGVAFLVAGPEPWIALAVGIVVAFFLFFTMLAGLQVPLRRQTRQTYPRAEHLYAVAHRSFEAGSAIAAATAAEEAAELIRQRDHHLQAADRWKQDQFEAIDQAIKEKETALRATLEEELDNIRQQFKTQIDDVDRQMLQKTNAVAATISHTIEEDQAAQQTQLRNVRQRHQQELDHLEYRFRVGISHGLQQIAEQTQIVEKRYPAWPELLQQGLNRREHIDFLPVGRLDISQRIQPQLASQPSSEAALAAGKAPPKSAPDYLPVVLHRRLHAGLLIDCPAAQIAVAVEIIQGILWRSLTGARAGRAQLTLIDPVGRGQHFAGLIALADHDPQLVNHRVWTTPAQLEARLAERTHHCEDVLQSSLRDRYPTIEHYNRVAGSLAEPYQLIAAVGVPTGLTHDSTTQLRALIESARRCGTFVLLIRDTDQTWPTGLPSLDDPRLLRLCIDDAGTIRHTDPTLGTLPFLSGGPPPAEMRPQLVEAVGQAAVNAARVEIPLEQILSADEEASGDTTGGLQIPIGSQGANRRLQLKLGEGVKQHVLIAGKTGSGKSTLLHSLITAGARRYRPDQLQMYLLDFKKGVEFQVYAEGPLPHARVIGIESEREFGRSVLERLDRELQQRGEQFRSAGVQEIGEFRKRTAEAMPRLLLVIDEFQELFVRDDRLAGDCAMFLDRLVRQGRSFGIHVVLSSQSLAGSYSLPRATLGQMAVRIALQCGESDAALILSDDNPAARLLSRPGEAIYNDAGGLIEGNQPFQVAWLEGGDHQRILDELSRRDTETVRDLGPPVVFAGNRPTRWTAALADAAQTPANEPADVFSGLLGESIEIGPPTTLRLAAATGRNALVVAPPEATFAVIASVVPSLVADLQRRHGRPPEVVVLDGNRRAAEQDALPSEWLEAAGVPLRKVRLRDAEQELARLRQAMSDRLEREKASAEAEEADRKHSQLSDPPTLLVITPLERFRELRQSDSYSFSLDPASDGDSGPDNLQALLRDGPQAGVFTILSCTSPETLTRWLHRSAHHDLELRLLARMSAADSSNLIDAPEASDLSAATMLLYDDADGRIKKFRYCDPPPAEAILQWLVGRT